MSDIEKLLLEVHAEARQLQQERELDQLHQQLQKEPPGTTERQGTLQAEAASAPSGYLQPAAPFLKVNFVRYASLHLSKLFLPSTKKQKAKNNQKQPKPKKPKK